LAGVSGWRKNRQDPLMKRFTSRGANLLRSILVHDGIHDSGCSLKIYRRECFEDVRLYGEMHRFIPALLKMMGFRVGEIVVDHRPRVAGRTKYNWRRTVKGFIDMISIWFWNNYAARPLHLLGGFGFVFLALGFFCGLWTIVLFLEGQDLSDNFQPILTCGFLGGGLFLFVAGLLADLLMRIYYGGNHGQPYSIRQIQRNDKEEQP
jgi:hypothetical protein